MNEIKTKWEDVTIEMYQELNTIQSDNEATLFIERVAVLADCDPEDIRQMSISKFRELQERLTFLQQEVPAIVDTKLEIDGVKYGMIPQLNFITAGEWIDAENWKEQPIDNIHLYAALLYRPITKENADGSYEIEPHKPNGFLERAELFKKKLSITNIHGTVLFFSTLGIQLMPILAEYSTGELKWMKEDMKTMQTQQATKKQKQQSSKKTGDSII